MRLIDADALIEIAKQDGAYDYVSAEEIANAPTIDAEPVKHGRWIDRGTVCQRYECSVCGDQHDWLILPNNINFCPNCGCAMTKEKEK